MQHTPNFNLNLPEGTDLWNYLTQTNPNFTALDTLLKSIQDGTVTTATEVTSGTAHAVTRTLPDANVIRFTATGVWTLGDTMTIDGTPVTVVKPNGTSLQTGDYIIGSEVLGILRATQFTVYVSGASSVDAADVTFDNDDNDNTHAWLTGTDVEAAIKETATEVDAINSKVDAINSNLFKYEFTELLKSTSAYNWDSVAVSDFSNYKAIAVAIGVPTDICNPATLPLSIFKTQCTTPAKALDSLVYRSNTVYQVGIYYIDDTHIGCINNANNTIHVWGVN